jgi:glycosyltransferase involved in cell wall biosynthesis
MLFYMIESIKKQKIMPDVLYVNISEGSYLSDEGISEIPEWLNQDFISINRTENFGSYRKLLPVIKKAKDNDLIITADDDILYGPNWIKSLVELAEKYPHHIVCARAREMKKNIFGRWQNYSRWNLISSAKDGMLILPTGVGGAVYRKHLLDLDFLLDPGFKKLAPTTDDLWFRMASLRRNVPVFVCPEIDMESIYLKHSTGLEQINFNKKASIFFQKVFNNTIGVFKDWIGLDATKNDHSWSKILEYANTNQTARNFNIKTQKEEN